MMFAEEKDLNQCEKIICFGYGNTLLNLIDNYDVIDKIDYVIDNDTKKQGDIFIGNKCINVCGIEKLDKVVGKNDLLLITSLYFDEIYNQIQKRNLKISNIKSYLSEIDRIKYEYRIRYEKEELENLILFRSGPIRQAYIEGTDFSDNARALYEYMIDKGFNNKYKIVWIVKDAYKERETIQNVEYISMDWEDSDNLAEREIYYRYLYTAKYIFITDAYGFLSLCRNDQIRVQLWHGCGFKTRVNFSRCENRYEFTTVVSELYKQKHAEIYGLREDQILVTGYAKQDWLYKPYSVGVDDLLEMAKAEKHIFWCPTFRMAEAGLESLNQYVSFGDTGLPILISDGMLEELNEYLKSCSTNLIIKLHPFQKRDLIKINTYSNIKVVFNEELVGKDLMINRLLAEADALISDYSSIAIDYLNLDRPIAFTIDDIDEYEKTRGFIFDNILDWLPGKTIRNYDEFMAFIKEIINGIDSESEKRDKMSKVYLKYKDNMNCKRIVEALGL